MEMQNIHSKIITSFQNESPPLLLRVYLQSPSPPSYNPLRDQMINQLHNISPIIDSYNNPSNAYIHAPPLPPPPQIHPPSHAKVELSSSFCHYGAFGSDGSGAGLILIDLDGKEITYALWFNFPTSNNEAEYEAIIAGLELALRLEVHHL
uniref:Reverse transcriptase domain-containing protein n=1 Tax=Tanacetum cinerariifolium TaxID=118510 RepID=A0A6L2NC50_TANCI|nr:reverse transcriptase domain-containing protein [Tanacetum cinerariifolium]